MFREGHWVECLSNLGEKAKEEEHKRQAIVQRQREEDETKRKEDIRRKFSPIDD